VNLESKKLDARGKFVNLFGYVEILLVDLKGVNSELRVDVIFPFRGNQQDRSLKGRHTGQHEIQEDEGKRVKTVSPVHNNPQS
jgi:hypothetical protein